MVTKDELVKGLNRAFSNDSNKVSGYLTWARESGMSPLDILKQDNIQKFLIEHSKKGDRNYSKYLFAKKVTCLFDNVPFTIYKLLPSAKDRFERTDEFLDILIYENPSGDTDFCNYLTIDVKVCPACYFSSNSDSYFIGEGTYVDINGVIDKQDTEAVAADKPKRLKIIDGGVSTIFTPERSLQDTITSYNLGISSSLTLFSTNNRKNAIELARIGNYAIKAARICQENDMKSEREDWLKTAFEYLKKTFDADLKGALYYKSLYQLSALAIYFKEDLIASRCYEVLRGLSKKEPSRQLNIYSTRLRKIWQDKDDYREK